MGLLDDAIREHLDLKRARGGDPAEIEKMEREALGPVRREPTIGSTRFEAGDEHAAHLPEGGYPDDREQLLNADHHDSTAPHSHEHIGHEHLEHELGDPFGADAHEQPKRRFLRRSRSGPAHDSSPELSLPVDPVTDPHGLPGHEDLLQHHELEHHEHHEPLEHDLPAQHAAPEPPAVSPHHESLAHHDLHETVEHHFPEQHDAPPADEVPTPPPHLQFDHPPKRPRFSAEPPSLHPEADEPAGSADEPPAPAPAPPPAQEAVDTSEVQETTEFDVQKHIAETRFKPEPETQVHRPAPPSEQPATEDEDVLEETPEFLQDTPEHDRLWFEQRPPRDFDFDG